MTNLANLYISYHNLPCSMNVNPPGLTTGIIVTDKPEMYGIQGIFIDFLDLKNVK